MAYDRFLIAPIEVGLEKDLKPWLTPDDSFQELNNAYVFRGRVRKRFGSRQSGNGYASDATQSLNSRLRIAMKSTDGTGTCSDTILLGKVKIGQIFSIGTTIYTIPSLGASVTMKSTDLTTSTKTINTTTGAFSFIGAPASKVVYYYPSEPVMGLTQYYSGSINNQPAFAFDTRYAYNFTSGAWIQNGPGTTWWHGTDSDFFWTCNFDGSLMDKPLLFASNFFVTNKNGAVDAVNDDPIRYWNGTVWTDYSPTYTKFWVAGNGKFIQTARIILPFKDRLVMLNTIERDSTNANNEHYQARCRFSADDNPLDAATFLEPDETGYKGGGWVDAATEEEIISAEFIKDRLIVYFERSTWELAYTGNQIQPFLWQKLNTELGSEATFSSVPFDKVVLTMSNVGVHACNGSNVDRVDSKIPDDVFQIRNANNGIKRVAGIRDFNTEMVYWTFPTSNSNVYSSIYPNKVMVYNYKNGSWAYNDDTFTCFGYFEQQTDRTWLTTPQKWNECAFSWNSGLQQADARQVIAGNHQGYILILDADINKNEQSMQITEVTFPGPYLARLTIYDHTLQDGDYIKIYNAVFNVGGVVTTITAAIAPVFVDDKDNIIIAVDKLVGIPVTATYMGGGTVARVSRIQITSKQWNPYIDQGKGVFLGKVAFAVQKTVGGGITVNYSTSASGLDMIADAQVTGSQLGSNVLDTYAYPTVPLEIEQDRLWHPVYLQADGETVQLNMYLSDAQMEAAATAECKFELEGIILFTQPTSANLY